MSNTVNILLTAAGGAAVVGALDKVRGSITSLATVALGTSSALAGLESGLDLGGKMNDLSIRTRETVRDLVISRRALDNAGIGADALAISAQQLARSISGVNEVGESTREVFERLELKPESLKVQSYRQQIESLSEAFAKIENPAERSAIAMKLFGRNGGEMLQLLGDRDGLSQAERDAGRLAERLQQNAARFDQIGDALTVAKLRMQEFWVVAAEKALPTLQKIADLVASINPAPLAAAAGSVATIFGASFAAKAVMKLDFAVLDWATRQGNPIGQAFAGRFLAPLTGSLARVMPVGLGLAVFAEVFNGLHAAYEEWKNSQLDAAGASFSRVRDVQQRAGGIQTDTDRASAIAAAKSEIDEVTRLLEVEEDRWVKNDRAIASYRQQLDELRGLLRALQGDWARATMERNRFHILTPAEMASRQSENKAWLKSTDAEAIRDEIAKWNRLQKPQEALDGLRQTLQLTEHNITLAQRQLQITKDDANVKRSLLEQEGKRVTLLEQIGELEKLVAQRENDKATFALSNELFMLERRRSLLETDFTRTSAEKFTERRQLLQSEIEAHERLLHIQQARLQATTDEAARATIHGQIQSSVDTISGLHGQQDQLGPNPNSWLQQSLAAVTQLRESWGTTAQQIAQTISGTIGTSVDKVSEGLTQWIIRAQSGRQMLLGVGQAVGVQIIQSIAKMGVTWAANLAMMAARWLATRLGILAADKSIAAAATAAMIPIAMAQSAIWAGPATLATIASWGGAAVAAPVEIAGSIATTQAMALVPGFLQGGVAWGPQLATLAEDGRPEVVFSAPAIKNLGGLDRVASLHAAAASGRINTSAAFTASSGGAAADMQSMLRDFAGRITLVNVQSEQEAKRIKRNSAAAADVVWIVKNNKDEIFRRGPG